MANPGITKRTVERVSRTGQSLARSDYLAIEGPAEIRVAGESLVVVMRTPGDDLELFRGLLFAEGVIGADQGPLVRAVSPGGLRTTEVGNVYRIDLPPDLVRARWPERSLYAASSCGVCGKTSIQSVEAHAEPIRSGWFVTPALITNLPGRLRKHQVVFAKTGGLHAAAAFTRTGEFLALREDVGRHNAVDKLVGWAMDAGHLPASDLILCVSGRLSFEIVQKALVAGFPITVAVSAPSSMAVDLAERFRMTLCGFVRDDHLNIYTHSTRISPE